MFDAIGFRWDQILITHWNSSSLKKNKIKLHIEIPFLLRKIWKYMLASLVLCALWGPYYNIDKIKGRHGKKKKRIDWTFWSNHKIVKRLIQIRRSIWYCGRPKSNLLLKFPFYFISFYIFFPFFIFYFFLNNMWIWL